MSRMRVLITGGGSGGHISPALAVAQRLRRDFSDVELLYVGGSLTMEGSTGESLESRLVKPTGIPFKLIHVGKLKRGGVSWSTFSRLWGFLPGLVEAWMVVRSFKPNVLFSSGGYVSLPVVIAAWLHRVPIIIHEQTAAVGLANSIAARLARRVAITFPQSAAYFAPEKVVLTGNPIQPEIIEPDLSLLRQTTIGKWLASPGLPIIYITGGGLGSHIINQTVGLCLEQLLTRYRVVHQCGAHAGFNDFDRLQSLVAALPEPLQQQYMLARHFSANEVGLIYHQASTVVARAGANTVLELAAYGLPAVLIPIPWVTHDEQTKNAQVLVEAGTAILLPERELSAERLLGAISERITALSSLDSSRRKARSLVDLEAATRLTRMVVEAGGR